MRIFLSFKHHFTSPLMLFMNFFEKCIFKHLVINLKFSVYCFSLNVSSVLNIVAPFENIRLKFDRFELIILRDDIGTVQLLYGTFGSRKKQIKFWWINRYYPFVNHT